MPSAGRSETVETERERERERERETEREREREREVMGQPLSEAELEAVSKEDREASCRQSIPPIDILQRKDREDSKA